MSQLRRSVKGDFVVSAKFFAGVPYLYFAKTKRGLVSGEKSGTVGNTFHLVIVEWANWTWDSARRATRQARNFRREINENLGTETIRKIFRPLGRNGDAVRPDAQHRVQGYLTCPGTGSIASN